jgi:ketosteroid isomerase-like protein
MLSRREILESLARWSRAWDDHDLDRVMELFHENIVFENWTGGVAEGKEALRKAWEPWFKNHGGFRFIGEDTFVDRETQKVLYEWTLEWPSNEKAYQGKREKRRGLDVIHFRDGKIIRKSTYCKTTLEIEGKRVKLAAERETGRISKAGFRGKKGK